MVKYLGKGEKSCIFKVFLQLHPEVVRVIFFSNSIPYIRYWPKKAIIKNSFFCIFLITSLAWPNGVTYKIKINI